MENVKIMLSGLSIMLATAIFHLHVEAALWTDYIAIAGFIIVWIGALSKEEK
jgi:hypothetical protein